MFTLYLNVLFVHVSVSALKRLLQSNLGAHFTQTPPLLPCGPISRAGCMAGGGAGVGGEMR